MKDKTITPTAVERKMRPNDFIVSKADTTGKITYGNRIFVEFSGYTEKELLGKQHNIVRHPDMPRSVFHLLWSVIKEGRECFAYVKNMTRDGSFYWVYANVTPDRDAAGNITGYLSVRRAPNPNAIQAIEPLYAAMRAAEVKAGSKNAIEAGTKVLLDALGEKTYDEFVFNLGNTEEAYRDLF